MSACRLIALGMQIFFLVAGVRAQPTTPDYCAETSLEPILKNIVKTAQWVPASSRRKLLDSLAADCPQTYSSASAAVVSQLGYADPNVVSQRFASVSSAYRQLHAKIAAQSIFPMSPPTGKYSVFVSDPLLEMQGRISRMAHTPLHSGVGILANVVVSRAAPVIFRPGFDKKSFTELQATVDVQTLSPYLTDAAISALQALQPVQKLSAVNSLQAWTSSGSQIAGATTDADVSVAIGQVAKLGDVVRQADAAVAAAAASVQTRVTSVAASIAQLATTSQPLLDPSGLATQGGTPQDPVAARAALYASDALSLLNSRPFEEIQQIVGDPSNPFIATLLSDSAAGSPVVSALQSIVTNTVGATDELGSTALAASAVLKIASLAGISDDAINEAAPLISNITGIATSILSGNPIGIISGVTSMFGLGGPSQEDLLAQQIDQRFNKMDQELGQIDTKLQAVLKTQQEIESQLSTINQKLDTVLNNIALLRTDVLTQLEKIDYDVLLDRSVSIDQTKQELNRCNTFLHIDDPHHLTWTQKSAYMASPGDMFNSCFGDLTDLVNYGRISSDTSVADIFVLEDNQDLPGFTNIPVLLSSIYKPALQEFGSDACFVNSYTQPWYTLENRNDKCGQLNSDPHLLRLTGKPAPDPTDPDVRRANDPQVKVRFSQMLNYKAVIGFAQTVMAMAPWSALTDRNHQNQYLVSGDDLSHAFEGVDTASARALVKSALLLADVGIAQMSAVDGTADPAVLYTQESDLPYGWHNTFPKALANDLMLHNLVRKQIADFGNPALIAAFMRSPSAATAASAGVNPPLASNANYNNLGDLLIQDSAVPSHWYVVYGNWPPNCAGGVEISASYDDQGNCWHIVNFKSRDDGFRPPPKIHPLDPFKSLDIVKKGPQTPILDCVDEQHHPYIRYTITNGVLTPYTRCDWQAKADFPGQPDPPQPDLSRLHPVLIDLNNFADLNQLTPTPEMPAIFQVREQLLWQLTEWASMDRLQPSDLQFLAAVDLLP